MYVMSIKSRIFRSMVLFALVAATATSVILAYLFFLDEEKELKSNLVQTGAYLQIGYDHQGEKYLEAIGTMSKDRITLVGTDGKVIYDNRASQELMENHNNREEIIRARTNRTDLLVRMSDTLSSQTCYYAVLLKDGNVLRVSREMNSIYYAIVKVLPEMMLIMLCLLIVFIIGSRLILSYLP